MLELPFYMARIKECEAWKLLACIWVCLSLMARIKTSLFSHCDTSIPDFQPSPPLSSQQRCEEGVAKKM